MKTYIAGKITGLDNFKDLFDVAEQELKKTGHVVMNPAILPEGFEQEEYMQICFSMIDVCEKVYFLKNWTDSKGARMEFEYAIDNEKVIEYEEVV